MSDSDTAKLFMHGRSQAVRLPKAYRMPGTEVRVRRDGDKVILEPVEAPKFDFATWRAELDALGAADFLPDGVDNRDLVEPDDVVID
jgi:antitoxin VapB